MELSHKDPLLLAASLSRMTMLRMLTITADNAGITAIG
jgi:hypothetical protein